MILSSIQELAIYTCFLIKKIRRLPYKRADVFFFRFYSRISKIESLINDRSILLIHLDVVQTSTLHLRYMQPVSYQLLLFSLLPQDNRCYLLLGKPSSSLVPLVPGLVFSSPVLKQQKSQSSIGKHSNYNKNAGIRDHSDLISGSSSTAGP